MISIITITYNAERFLERTIQSIVTQQQAVLGEDYEYLIVDGASTDGTVAMIRRYERHISGWVSEPDKGLYDAMNKGLHRATGDYVWFMNAGDELHDSQTLHRLLERIRTQPADVYYSDALFVQENGEPVGLRSQVTPHSLPAGGVSDTLHWRDMALGMKVSHQAFVARRQIAPDYPVTNLSADLDWEIRCLKAAAACRIPSISLMPLPRWWSFEATASTLAYRSVQRANLAFWLVPYPLESRPDYLACYWPETSVIKKPIRSVFRPYRFDRRISKA